MNYKKSLISIAIISSLFMNSCSKIPTNANTAFRNYTLTLFRNDVSSNTLNLHYTLKNPAAYGIANTPTTLGTFSISPEAVHVFYENCQAALDKFSYDSLSAANQLTYDILSYYINVEKTGVDYYLYEEPLSPVTGIHAQLPLLLAEYRLSSESDVSTYLELLKTMPEYVSSLIAFEEAKSVAGLFMSDKVLDDVLEQCTAFLSMGDQNYLITSFIERLSNIPELSAENRSAYISANEAIVTSYVYPSYQMLITSLESLRGSGTNDQGVCHFPNGNEYITYLLASETGSNRSLSEIKALIESYLADDLLQMMENASNTSPALTYESPIDILEDLKEDISIAFPQTPSAFVEIKYVPKALEEHVSPAFYFIPTIDDMSQNTIYINPSYELESIQLFSTLAHEGYPGHLYQTTYFDAQNPDPLRQLLSFKGYVEGWATYAEMCSYYLMPLDKKSATYAQKNNSLLLGLYAMADFGIHCEGWSISDTISFFKNYGIQEESVIEDIYSYILGDPINYLSYYVGYLEILELKKEANLSQKDFHQSLLELGPAPFSVLREHLLN